MLLDSSGLCRALQGRHARHICGKRSVLYLCFAVSLLSSRSSDTRPVRYSRMGCSLRISRRCTETCYRPAHLADERGGEFGKHANNLHCHSCDAMGGIQRRFCADGGARQNIQHTRRDTSVHRKQIACDPLHRCIYIDDDNHHRSPYLRRKDNGVSE